MADLTETQQRDFEAAAFRRLVEHLRERTDVQNIDLMNLAGFCRNCLSNWYREAAEAEGVALCPRTSRGRSSTACPTPNGSRNTSTRRPTRRRRRSRPAARRITERRTRRLPEKGSRFAP